MTKELQKDEEEILKPEGGEFMDTPKVDLPVGASIEGYYRGPVEVDGEVWWLRLDCKDGEKRISCGSHLKKFLPAMKIDTPYRITCEGEEGVKSKPGAKVKLYRVSKLKK